MDLKYTDMHGQTYDASNPSDVERVMRNLAEAERSGDAYRFGNLTGPVLHEFKSRAGILGISADPRLPRRFF